MATVQKRESILYVLITFLISWASWGALILLGMPAQKNALSMSLYLLGGLSTAIVAFVLPLFLARGERKAHYKRYFNFKIPARWYLLAVVPALIMVLLTYGTMLVFEPKAAAGLNIQPLYMMVPLFISMVVGGGVEEFGWRGIVVHNMQKTNPILISLGTGLLWAAWHIPLFFINGVGQYHANFLPFLISVLTYSFILTPLYRKSGSVIPCIVFHALVNAFGDLGFRYGNDLLIASMIDSLIRLGIGFLFFAVINSKWLSTAQKRMV